MLLSPCGAVVAPARNAPPYKSDMSVCYYHSSLMKANDHNRAQKLKRSCCAAPATPSQTFNMIEEGDRVMVLLSGVKDAYTLLALLLDIQRRARSLQLLPVISMQSSRAFPNTCCRLPDRFRNSFRIIHATPIRL